MTLEELERRGRVRLAVVIAGLCCFACFVLGYGLGVNESQEPEKFLPSSEYKETTSHFLCHQDRYRCRIYILKEPINGTSIP